VQRSRQFFERKRNQNRSRVLGFGLATVSLSAVATVAIGATKLLSMDSLQVVALIATASATIVGVWENVFAYRKLWNLNNIALAGLDGLQRRMDYRMSSDQPVTEAEADAFFKEYDQLIASVDKSWIETYASSK
jgi:hypothetical protein